MVVQNKTSRKQTHGGKPNLNSLQKSVLQADSDSSIKVLAEQKQNVSTKKGNKLKVDFPSQKSILVNNNKKGKEQLNSKIAPIPKNSWKPKYFEIGKSSTLNKNQSLELPIPISSSHAFRGITSEENPVPSLGQEFEFLSNLPISYTPMMGFKPSISHCCFENSILGKLSENAKQSSPSQSQCLSGTSGTQALEKDPRPPCSTRVEKSGPAAFSLEGISGLTLTTDTTKTRALSCGFIEPTVCLSSSEAYPDRPRLVPIAGRGIRELHTNSHHPNGVTDGLGIENDQILGKLVEGSELGDPNLDADNGAVLSPCRSPRISIGQHQIHSFQGGEQFECKSFPRLRKIFENSRGTGDKNSQDRPLFTGDIATSSARVAINLRPRAAKNSRKPKSTVRNV
ncbi:hypothetical protein COLO4_35998 [Corchorus olitorius]|uniref:Uncharacterized protein n=1 Tax=Corchorus olitorius TaxID=93759 RepID=A0A1R3GBJ0_9ROSI|nr:hypothetical protein COLO4_35998 [Corchorus olitorius]